MNNMEITGKFTADKALVIIYREGGYKTRGGGHVKFYPWEKGGLKKF